MSKDNLKAIINKYVGYAEQEIYDALEEVYTKDEVRELINSFASYHSINWLSPITKDWIKHNNL